MKTNPVKPRITRDELENLYARFDKRELVHPDPLETLYRYPTRWTGKLQASSPPVWLTAT